MCTHMQPYLNISKYHKKNQDQTDFKSFKCAMQRVSCCGKEWHLVISSLGLVNLARFPGFWLSMKRDNPRA